jgi:hypothetical protein
MSAVSRRFLQGALCVALLALAPGCIIKVPITDKQSVAFPPGTFDVSLGGPGEQVFNLTVPITSLCQLPTRQDLFDDFTSNGQGVPLARLLLQFDHAWVDAFSFAFDGADFYMDTELIVRIVGPDGELARARATQILPLAGLVITAKPKTPIDLLSFDLPPGECLHAEIIITGTNPRNNVPVRVGIGLSVELHTRGFIDVSAFGLP